MSAHKKDETAGQKSSLRCLDEGELVFKQHRTCREPFWLTGRFVLHKSKIRLLT